MQKYDLFKSQLKFKAFRQTGGVVRLATGMPGTGRAITGRLGTGAPGNAPRPMTAVRAAGFSSSPQGKIVAPPLQQPKEDS